MSNKILSELKPSTRIKAENFIKKLDEIGFRYMLKEGLRSDMKQFAYYLQGRVDLEIVNIARGLAGKKPTRDKWKITECDGFYNKSKHQTGEAIDIVPLIDGRIPWDTEKHRDAWLLLGDIGKDCGFRWGGDWGKTATKLGWDCPHFEE